MTIHKKERAIKLLSDPEFPIAYSYQGLEMQQLWAFFTHPEYDDIYRSPFAINPVCLKAGGELTDEGVLLVEGKA